MKREEKSKMTKEKLLKAAIELISKKGYENLIISEICKGAGVAKGTFYVHFESKDDIIKSIYYGDMNKFVFTEFDDYILKGYGTFIEEKPNLTIKEKIIYFIKLEFQFAKNMGSKMVARGIMTSITDYIEERTSNFERRKFGKALENLIREGIEKEEFLNKRSAEEIFITIDSFSRGLVESWCLSKEGFDIEILGEKLIRELVNNI